MGHVLHPGLRRRRERGLIRIVLALALQGLGISQVQGPSLGVLFDTASGQLYPIIGIPGSATIGKPFEVGQTFSTAAVCSAGGFALGVAQPDGQVRVISWTGTPQAAALPGAPASPDRMILSPSCTSAALVYSSAAQAQLITGLPDHPSLSAVDLSVLGSPPGAVAVDDTGAFLLVATSTNGSSSVNRLSAGQQPEIVASASGISAIAFLRKSSDAVIADSVLNQLLLVRNAARGSAVPNLVATKHDGIVDAASVAISSDNRYVFVANATTNSVTILDLKSQATQQVSCSCKVEGIIPLKNGSTFLLNDQTDRPLTVLEASRAQPRVTLIPAVSPSVKGNAQ